MRKRRRFRTVVDALSIVACVGLAVRAALSGLDAITGMVAVACLVLAAAAFYVERAIRPLLREIEQFAAEDDADGGVRYRLRGGPGDGTTIPPPPPEAARAAEEFADRVGATLSPMRFVIVQFPGGVYEFSDDEADVLVWRELDDDETVGAVDVDGVDAETREIFRALPEGMKMRGVRALVNEAARQHDDEEHDGVFCVTTRLSMIAFLAHSLGLRAAEFPGHVEPVTSMIYEYERDEHP